MEKRQVIVPIADLRKEPKQRIVEMSQEDPLQESQCLYGETVYIKKRSSGWCLVEVCEQGFFSQNLGWGKYLAWVEESSLGQIKSEKPTFILKKHLKNSSRFLGSYLIKDELLGIPEDAVVSYEALSKMSFQKKLELFVGTARLFLGATYFWGGLGGELSKPGIDCSGLVHLCARVLGLSLPRNSHHQFLNVHRVGPENLSLGDLVFLSRKERPGFVHHVMIYAGGEQLIEATVDSGNCREISLIERLGIGLEDLEREKITAGGCLMFFGKLV